MSKEIELHLNNYDGPLDLLLDLVKEKKMDIFAIDLVELATEYLKLIDILKDANIDLASDYLVMAATLLQIKTKMILERPDEEEEVVPEAQDLLAKLYERQRYKEAATKLRERELERRDIFIKDTSNYDQYVVEIDETKLDGKSDVIKLIQQMRKMFERINAQKMMSTTIEAFNLSPADRRIELIELFKIKVQPTFRDIFNVPTINHFVVTMITILDMARKQELLIQQDEQFGEIRI